MTGRRSSKKEADVVLQGRFWKRGDRIKSWNLRQFILLADGTIKYYKSATRNNLKGAVALDRTSKVLTGDKLDLAESQWKKDFNPELRWAVTTFGRTFYFTALREEDKKEWVEAVSKAIKEEKIGDTHEDVEAFVNDAEAATHEITRLLTGATHSMKEWRILKILAVSNVDVLNSTLRLVNLQQLFADVHGKNSVTLFDILEKRSEELDLETRVLLVDAVQQCKNIDMAQRLVTGVILSTYGSELYALKRAIDSGADRYDMVHLVYDFIKDFDLRNSILLHIREQANNEMSQPNFQRPLAILSDIDDTVKQSPPSFGLGGPKYPTGKTLPGVVELYEEIGGIAVFITARPEFMESSTHKMLRQNLGFQDATILSGRLSDSILVPFNPEYCNRLMAETKFVNYVCYRDVFPETQFMWFGDSGQGDIQFGLNMLMEDEKNEYVVGVNIQDVTLKNGIDQKTPDDKREELLQQNVRVSTNYLDVAVAFFKSGRLTPLALHRIASAALKQLESYKPDMDADVWAKRVEEYSASVDAVNQCFSVDDGESFTPLAVPL